MLQSDNAPLRKKKKELRVIQTRVNEELSLAVDSVCEQLNLNPPAIFREGFALFCQHHPKVSAELAQQVADAVSRTRSFYRVGRLTQQVNEGEG